MIFEQELISIASLIKKKTNIKICIQSTPVSILANWNALTSGGGVEIVLSKDFTVVVRYSLGISILRLNSSCFVSIICRSIWIS